MLLALKQNLLKSYVCIALVLVLFSVDCEGQTTTVTISIPVLSNYTLATPAPVNPTPVNGNEPVNSQEVIKAHRNITLPGGIGGLILVGSGFYLCFFGQKHVLPTMFFAGFYFWGLITYMILNAISDRVSGYGSNVEWIYLVAMFVIGMIGAFFMRGFVLVGCLALGALLGFFGSNLVFVTGLGAVIQQPAHITVVVMCMLISCGFMFFYENITLVIATALTGAYAIMLGLDTFARTGFLEVSHLAFQAMTPPVERIPGPSWGMMASVVVLAVLGWAMQTRPAPSGSLPSAKPFVWFWPWGGEPVKPTTWLAQSEMKAHNMV
ncbi:hypothetical protein HK098_000014 [Nowakowskiella sp. JEL0407]|nr:hypothetical protein HK098_000014 [Nowakowskiella sp. JEL0407]